MPQSRKPFRSLASALLGLAFVFPLLAADSKPSNKETALADSMVQKIEHIKTNADKESPDQTPTFFSEDEINACFAQRRLKMPDGVKSVVFELEPELVHATAVVDFDQITASKRSSNPLFSIFTGVHDVEASAFAEGLGGGMAHIEVESVKIDGITVPKIAMRLFIEKWVNPKYPKVKLSGDYKLPTKIDTVVIERDKGTVTQK
jgi:hypothetical protein